MTKFACFGLTLFGAFVFLSGTHAQAGTSCKNVFDPRFPGLQQCVASVDVDHLEANPPDPQKMSLWCWAASLSVIYTASGHPISQESIVIQNFGKPENATGGDFLTFSGRLNRVYTDDDGKEFRSVATGIATTQEAADALDNDLPILYTTSHHATVQFSITYQVAPNGPVAFKGGEIWDPEPGIGNRHLSLTDVATYTAAWSIDVQDVH